MELNAKEREKKAAPSAKNWWNVKCIDKTEEVSAESPESARMKDPFHQRRMVTGRASPTKKNTNYLHFTCLFLCTDNAFSSCFAFGSWPLGWLDSSWVLARELETTLSVKYSNFVFIKVKAACNSLSRRGSRKAFSGLVRVVQSDGVSYRNKKCWIVVFSRFAKALSDSFWKKNNLSRIRNC